MSGGRGAKRTTTTTTIGFSIGIAAERTGMHPQTLREYERKGLVRPVRTPGGARRYREQEIAQLRRIQELTELGLSLAGVAYVLELEAKLREQAARISELERGLVHGALLQQSTSLEIVHIPRQRRGPRWSNRNN